MDVSAAVKLLRASKGRRKMKMIPNSKKCLTKGSKCSSRLADGNVYFITDVIEYTRNEKNK